MEKGTKHKNTRVSSPEIIPIHLKTLDLQSRAECGASSQMICLFFVKCI